MSARRCKHCQTRLAEYEELVTGECHDAYACRVTELDRAGFDELATLGQLSDEHAAIDAELPDLERWRTTQRRREASREWTAQFAG